MFDAHKEIQAEGKLELFEELLWEWVGVIERAVRSWAPEEFPWWYSERALLSTFSGSIWKSGGLAFEEFSAKRHVPRGGAKTASVPKTGRVDLYFELHGDAFLAEAKHCWSAASDRAQDPRHSISALIEKAGGEVTTAQEEEARRLAMVFAAPYFPISAQERGVQFLYAWRDAVVSLRADCKALYCLDDFIVTETEGYYYPGIALILSQVAAQ